MCTTSSLTEMLPYIVTGIVLCLLAEVIQRKWYWRIRTLFWWDIFWTSAWGVLIAITVHGLRWTTDIETARHVFMVILLQCALLWITFPYWWNLPDIFNTNIRNRMFLRQSVSDLLLQDYTYVVIMALGLMWGTGLYLSYLLILRVTFPDLALLTPTFLIIQAVMLCFYIRYSRLLHRTNVGWMTVLMPTKYRRLACYERFLPMPCFLFLTTDLPVLLLGIFLATVFSLHFYRVWCQYDRLLRYYYMEYGIYGFLIFLVGHAAMSYALGSPWISDASVSMTLVLLIGGGCLLSYGYPHITKK